MGGYLRVSVAVPDDVVTAVARFFDEVAEAADAGGVSHYGFVVIGADRTVSVHGAMAGELGQALYAAGAAQVARDYTAGTGCRCRGCRPSITRLDGA